MKIKKFHISDYGPLPDRGNVNVPEFGLFYGLNESGKTLTVDALIKLLVGDKIDQYRNDGLDRIDEMPDGYIKIENETKEFKLDKTTKISQFIDISDHEFSKLFIIRDSDLSFENQKNFYNNITDKLLGLRFNDIDTIIDAVYGNCSLTSKGSTTDRKPVKLKTRIKRAKNLINQIEAVRNDLEDIQFDVIDEEIIIKQYEIQGIETELDHYRDAQKREQYEAALKAYNEYIEKERIAENLKEFSEDTLGEWQNLERDLGRTLNDHDSCEKDLEKKEGSKLDLDKKIAGKAKNLGNPKNIKEELDKRVKIEINAIRKDTIDLAGDQKKKEPIRYLFGVTTILFLGFLMWGVISSLLLLITLSFIFIFISSVSVYQFWNIGSKDAKLSEELESLRIKMTRLGLKGNDIGQMLNAIDHFEQEFSSQQKELRDLEYEYESLSNEIVELRKKKIPELSQKIKNIQAKIDHIMKTSDVASLDDYRAKLETKISAIAEKTTQTKLLNQLFSTPPKSEFDVDAANYWKEQLDNLEEYKERSQEYTYNETEVERLIEKKQTVENYIAELKNELIHSKEQMDQIREEAKDILIYESDPHEINCKNLKDLDRVLEIIKGFIKKYKNQKRRAKIVKKVFKEIKSEENKKIAALLSENSTIIPRFRKVTDGAYQDIVFDNQKGEISVVNAQGELIPAKNLSGGTFDQLYFAIRVGIGELLFGDKGFFILDDPFIKADYERLRRLLSMLRTIANEGWQVLYFSSKKEVKELLEDEIKNGSITLLEFQRLLKHTLSVS